MKDENVQKKSHVMNSGGRRITSVENKYNFEEYCSNESEATPKTPLTVKGRKTRSMLNDRIEVHCSDPSKDIKPQLLCTGIGRETRSSKNDGIEVHSSEESECKPQTRRAARALKNIRSSEESEYSSEESEYNSEDSAAMTPQPLSTVKGRERIEYHEDDSDVSHSDPDDSSVISDAKIPPKNSSRTTKSGTSLNRTIRNRLPAKSKGSSSEEYSDSDVISDAYISPKKTRKTTKRAPSSNRTTRNRAPTKSKGSSSEEYSDNYSEEDLDDISVQPKRNTRKRNSRKAERKSKRKKLKRADVEVDVDSFSEDSYRGSSASSEKSDYNIPIAKKSSVKTNKRKQAVKKAKAKCDLFPDVPRWHSVEGSKLLPLANAILTRLEQKDSKNNFKDPVIEKYPLLAESYLLQIEQPMDFKTIRQRLETYKGIQFLQADLILIFRNCCRFNGENSPLSRIAIDNWKYLTDVYKEACQDLDIRLPRCW